MTMGPSAENDESGLIVKTRFIRTTLLLPLSVGSQSSMPQVGQVFARVSRCIMEEVVRGIWDTSISGSGMLWTAAVRSDSQGPPIFSLLLTMSAYGRRRKPLSELHGALLQWTKCAAGISTCSRPFKRCFHAGWGLITALQSHLSC
jgi:hypothetical protein